MTDSAETIRDSLRAAGVGFRETSDRIPGAAEDLATRFRWRAERRRRKLDEHRLVPFYRWEVIREDGRWRVVAFQNLAVEAPATT